MYGVHICLSKGAEQEQGKINVWSRVEQNKETEKKRGKEKSSVDVLVCRGLLSLVLFIFLVLTLLITSCNRFDSFSYLCIFVS